MLKYIEETTEDNVTNQDIAAVENLGNKVKRSKEVSISYMKSWEWEQMIREEATQEGRQLGKEEGITEATQKSIKIFIETCREFGASKEDTLSKLMEKYHLSANDTQDYVERYWS